MAYTLNRRLAQLVDSNGQLNTGKIPNDYISSDHIADNVITASMLHTSFTVSTSNLTAIDTDDVSEGSTNIYFTNARADARIAAATTDDLTEGSTNLYFTNARVDSHLSGGTGVTYSSGEISIGQDVGTSATPTFGNITTTGYIAGPATFTIDPAAVGDNTGTVVIAGNLQVDGTTTTINSTTLTVDDKRITLASGSLNAAAADGAGIEVEISGATYPSIKYDGTNDEWDFNKPINLTGDGHDLLINSADYELVLLGNRGSTGVNLDKAYLRMKAEGTNTIVIDTAGNSYFNGGNVGIGTSSPGYLLTVKKDVDSFIMKVENDGNSPGTSGASYTDASDGLWVDTRWNTATNTPFKVTSNSGNTPMMIIKGNGNVGIGTTAPAYLLHLEDSNGADLALGNSTVSPSAGDYLGRIYALDSTNGFFAGINMFYHDDNDGEMRFRVKTNGTNTDVMTLVDGNVGIGTSSPTYGLDLLGATNYKTVRIGQTTATGTKRQAIAARHYTSSEQDHNMIGMFTDSNTNSILAIGGGLGATGDFNSVTEIQLHTGNGTTVNTAAAMTIDDTGDATFAGTISSGAITSTGTISTSSILQVNVGTASHQLFRITRANSTVPALYMGVDSSNNAMIAANNSATRIGKDIGGTFYDYLTITAAGNVNVKNNLEINGTTVIDSSRNLTNIGTISSGQLQVNVGATNTIAVFESTDDKGFIQIKDNDTNAHLIAKDGNFSIADDSGTFDTFRIDLDTGNVDISGTFDSGAITSSSGITATGPFKSGGSNNYILFDYDGDFTGGNYYAIQDTSDDKLRISRAFSTTDCIEMDSSGNVAIHGGTLGVTGVVTGGSLVSTDGNLNSIAISAFKRNDSTGATAESSQWRSTSSYAYDVTNGTRFYWIKVLTMPSSNCRGVLEYETKTDENYPGFTKGTIAFSSFNGGASFSVQHDQSTAEGVSVTCRLDTSRALWVQFSASWASNSRWRITQFGSSATVDTSWSVGSNKLDPATTSVPPNSSSNIDAGKNLRATSSSVAGALPSYQVYKKGDVRSDIQIIDDHVVYNGAVPLNFHYRGSDTYTKTTLYDGQNDTANNAFSGLTLEMGRLTNSGSATPRTFTISDRGATNKWVFSQYGLSFNPANNVASAAESLDDYEEGTWIPTDASGQGITGFTLSHNQYTKIGRKVFAHCQITFPSSSNTTLARLSLPFAPNASSNNSATGGVCQEQNISSSITVIAAVNYTNGLIFRPNGFGNYSWADLSGKTLRFAVHYNAS